MRILLIKTGTTIASLLQQGEDFERWFLRGMGLQSGELTVCNVFSDEPLPALATVDGIVISCSPAFLTDFAPWNFVAAEFLRQANAEGIPVLGVCYGHQLLAWAFGGSVDFNPRGREIGSVSIELEAAAQDDLLFGGFPTSIDVQASHLQSVVQLPPGAQLLAGNDLDSNHGFRLGDRAWGVQFHPEFDADIIRAYIRERAAELVAEGLDPQALLDGVKETEIANSLLRRFVSFVARQSGSA